MPPPPAQPRHRRRRSHRRAQGVQREVRAAARQLPYGLGRAARPRVHAVRRPEPPRQLQRSGSCVHGDHPRPGRHRDHHRRQAHPAAPVHGDPLARRHPPLRDHGPERRREPAAEPGRRHVRELLRHGHEIDVGMVQGHVLRERPPVREPGLRLPRAHLLIAGRAVGAAPAGADERHGGPVPGPPAHDPGAHRLHHAGEFVPGHVRQHDVRIVPHPPVPVAAAQPGRLDAHHDPARGRNRIGHLEDLGRLPVLPEHHRAHGNRPPLDCPARYPAPAVGVREHPYRPARGRRRPHRSAPRPAAGGAPTTPPAGAPRTGPRPARR